MAVDCQDVHAALREGSLADSSPLGAHVDECPACTELVGAGPGFAAALDEVAPADGFDQLWAEVEAGVAKEHGLGAWLRSRPTPLRLVLAVIGASLVPLGVGLLWTRVDLAAYPADRWALDLAVLLVPVGVALALVLRPLHRPALPRWVEPAAVSIAFAAALMGAVLTPAHHGHPVSAGATGDAFWGAAAKCLGIGTLMGAPLLLWLTSLRRGGERWSRPALLAAMAAGAAGVLAIFLHCPFVAPMHLLLGHATVLLPFLVLGWLGRRG